MSNSFFKSNKVLLTLTLVALALATVPLAANTLAAENCVHLSGSYTKYFMGRWIMRMVVEQPSCEVMSAEYTLPTGEHWRRTLSMDGAEHLTGHDSESDLSHYETIKADALQINLSGRTTEAGALKSYWKGSWKLNAQKSLVDHSEEFDGRGVSQGPITVTYLKD